MNSKRKIIVFTTSYLPFIGGAEIAIQEVSRRLSDSFDFYIITARQKRELLSQEIVPEGTVIRVGFGMSFDKWLLPLFGIWMVMRLAIFGVIPRPWKKNSRTSLMLWGMDISQGSFSARIIKILFPHVPFVFTVQYGDGDMRLEKGRMGLIGKAFQWILSGSDVVTVISTYLLDVAHTYDFAGTTQVIPNGVDTSLFRFRSSEHGASGRSSSQRVIITTSRLVHKNGVDTLIRAVAEVKDTSPSIKCYIIGDGPERNTLEKLARDLQLSRDIIFLGSVPYGEIPFYLEKADVFVRASRSEGMGNSFVEALSIGIPIIGTSVGGIPDIIKNNETGMFCRVDDSQDLAKKIIQIFEDSRLVIRLRKQGRRLVEERFSWDAIAKSYELIFEKMFNARKRVLIATPLYPPEIGGPATYTKLLADNLLDAGVSTRIVRFSDVRRLPKILRHVAYAWRIVWQSRYVDIIYAQDPVSVGFPAAIAALITRKSFVLKIVGDYAWEQGTQRFGVTDLLDTFLQTTYGFSVEMMRKIERFTAMRAARIIVPSNYLKRVVIQWGVHPERIIVIPNSFEVPEHLLSHEEARKILGLEGTVLVSAGRLVPWKGFSVLLDAVTELVQHDARLSLIIVGSGPLEKELRMQIHALGIDAQVKLIGKVTHDEMLMYVAASDAFVLNTGYEGFSHALLEAMTVGTPVVTTMVGGNIELIKDKENGFLAEYNNKENLIHAIASVLSMSSTERKQLIARAQKTACQFTKKRMMDETARFFKNL